MNYPLRLVWRRIEYTVMPRLYLEVKVPMVGKLSAHARLPDITEYAAVFNLDPHAGDQSPWKFIRKLKLLA
jgi:hypothetical protein